jgi:hypothetical protein
MARAGRIDSELPAIVAYRQMSQKTYLKTAGAIFLIIAVLHLLRLVLGWSTVFEGWSVPQWPSAVALVVAGYLAYEGFRLSK